MVETEVTSLLSPWLTPTCLFILLNIVLGTILLLNNHHQSKNQKNESGYSYDYRNQDDAVSLVPPPPQLVRAPSLFSRVSSFNFSQYYSEHVPMTQDVVENTATQPTLARAPSLLYRVASFKFCWATREADGEGKMVNDNHHDHHQQQQQEEEVEVTKVKKVNNKKKKVRKEVAVVKETAAFKEKDEKVQVDSKVKETTAFKGEEELKTTALRGEDEQVDSKADDFINRFKQQLKMQRLESMIRYRTNIAAN